MTRITELASRHRIASVTFDAPDGFRSGPVIHWLPQDTLVVRSTPGSTYDPTQPSVNYLLACKFDNGLPYPDERLWCQADMIQVTFDAETLEINSVPFAEHTQGDVYFILREAESRGNAQVIVLVAAAIFGLVLFSL